MNGLIRNVPVDVLNYSIAPRGEEYAKIRAKCDFYASFLATGYVYLLNFSNLTVGDAIQVLRDVKMYSAAARLYAYAMQFPEDVIGDIAQGAMRNPDFAIECRSEIVEKKDTVVAPLLLAAGLDQSNIANSMTSGIMMTALGASPIPCTAFAARATSALETSMETPMATPMETPMETPMATPSKETPKETPMETVSIYIAIEDVEEVKRHIATLRYRKIGLDCFIRDVLERRLDIGTISHVEAQNRDVFTPAQILILGFYLPEMQKEALSSNTLLGLLMGLPKSVIPVPRGCTQTTDVYTRYPNVTDNEIAAAVGVQHLQTVRYLAMMLCPDAFPDYMEARELYQMKKTG